MNAHKLAATLMEDGTLVLEGLPFHAGDTLEIFILEQSKLEEPVGLNSSPLAGSVLRYEDPFESAVPPED